MPESEATRRPPGDDREDRHMVHVHVFNTLTDVAHDHHDHQHIVMGTTGPAREAGPDHIHRIRVRTSFYDGHWHWYDIMTGPLIETMAGGHVHAFDGETSFDDGHSHDVADTTAQGPDYREEEEEEDELPPPPMPAKPKPKTGKR